MYSSKYKRCLKDYGDSVDKIGNFIQDCLIYTPNKNVDGATLYTVYKQWCKNNGYQATSNRTFYQDLRDCGKFTIDSGKVNGKLTKVRIKDHIIENPLEWDLL